MNLTKPIESKDTLQIQGFVNRLFIFWEGVPYNHVSMIKIDRIPFQRQQLTRSAASIEQQHDVIMKSGVVEFFWKIEQATAFNLIQISWNKIIFKQFEAVEYVLKISIMVMFKVVIERRTHDSNFTIDGTVFNSLQPPFGAVVSQNLNGDFIKLIEPFKMGKFFLIGLIGIKQSITV